MSKLQLIQHSQRPYTQPQKQTFSNFGVLINESQALQQRIDSMIPRYDVRTAVPPTQSSILSYSPDSRTVAALQHELDRLSQKQRETNSYMANRLNLQLEQLGDVSSEQAHQLPEQSMKSVENCTSDRTAVAKPMRYQKSSQSDRLRSHYDQLLSGSVEKHIENAKIGINKLNSFDLQLLRNQQGNAHPPVTTLLPENLGVQVQKPRSPTQQHDFQLLDMNQLDVEPEQPQEFVQPSNEQRTQHQQSIMDRLQKMQKSLHIDKSDVASQQQQSERQQTAVQSAPQASPPDGRSYQSLDEKSYDDYNEQSPVRAAPTAIQNDATAIRAPVSQFGGSNGISVAPGRMQSYQQYSKKAVHKYSLQNRTDDAVLAQTDIFGQGSRAHSMKNRPSSVSRQQKRDSSFSICAQPMQRPDFSIAQSQYEKNIATATQRHSKTSGRILPYHEELAPIAKSPLNRTSSPKLLRMSVNASKSMDSRQPMSTRSSLNIQALRESLETVRSRNSVASGIQYNQCSKPAPRVTNVQARRDAAQQTELLEHKVENIERMARLRKQSDISQGQLSDKRITQTPQNIIPVQPEITTKIADPLDPLQEFITNPPPGVQRTEMLASTRSTVPELLAKKISTKAKIQQSIQSPPLLNFEIDEQKTPVALNEASMLRSQKLQTNEQAKVFNAQIGESLYQNKIFLDQDSLTQYKMDLDWDE